MSIWDDPRDYIDIESQPCQIGSGSCQDMAAGTCEDCGKRTCRGCADDDDNGYLHCFDCQPQAEQQKKKVAA